MRASYIQTPGDRRTTCPSCLVLRPVRAMSAGICTRCVADGITLAEVEAYYAKQDARRAKLS